jgi:hypothetical protein
MLPLWILALLTLELLLIAVLIWNALQEQRDRRLLERLILDNSTLPKPGSTNGKDRDFERRHPKEAIREYKNE